MIETLLQPITIYHKAGTLYERYNVMASVRNTTYMNRNNTGLQSADNCLIRVFDVDNYGNIWKCEKGDVIVTKEIYDDINTSPLTELRNSYGKDNVVEVSNITIYNFDNEDIKELNHIKIGAR